MSKDIYKGIIQVEIKSIGSLNPNNDPIPIHVPGLTKEIVIFSVQDFENAWEKYGEGDCPEYAKTFMYNAFRYSSHRIFKLVTEPIDKNVGEGGSW